MKFGEVFRKKHFGLSLTEQFCHRKLTNTLFLCISGCSFGGSFQVQIENNIKQPLVVDWFLQIWASKIIVWFCEGIESNTSESPLSVAVALRLDLKSRGDELVESLSERFSRTKTDIFSVVFGYFCL